MTYRAHVDEIARRMTSRLRQLRRLAGRSWGCCGRDLRTVYLAYIRSVADYCGACFLPAASKSTMRRLEVIQRQAARIITGCVASTPTGALEREANLMPFRLRGQQLAGCALVRAATSLADEPLHRLIDDRRHVMTRLKVERSWLPHCTEIVTKAELCTRDIRGRPRTLALPPWRRWADLDVRTDLQFQPADNTPGSKREAAERTLANLPRADYVVWTDGSVSATQRNGGAGFVIESDGSDTMTGRVAAGRHSSSYATELTAILAAARHLLRRLPATALGDCERPEVRFCTDSRSAGPTTRTDSLYSEVWQILSALSCRCHITMQWVPSHCGIRGNEEADAQAANACRLEQRRIPIAYDAALAAVRRSARRQWLEEPQPEWHTRAAGPIPNTSDLQELPRADAVTVAQLRTGHSVLLGGYKHRIGLATTPTCQDCGFDDIDTAEHLLLSCPAHHRLRSDIFGYPYMSDPSLVFARPADVVEFVRRAGRMRPRI